MAHRAAHTLALRLALRGLLEAPTGSLRRAHRLGLAQPAVHELCAVHECIDQDRNDAVLVLQFTGDLPGGALPRRLRSPLDGRAVPVRSLRCAQPPRAQTAWVRARNRSHFVLDGSLGAVLRLGNEPSRLMALTAGHVCGASFSSTRGDALLFETQGVGPAPFEGVLLDWQPNFTRLAGSIEFDAGIAEIAPQAVADWLSNAADWPCGTAAAFADEALLLRTRGSVIAGRVAGLADARLMVAGDDARCYVLRDALCWRPESATQGGDSGAPVWNVRSELVALHIGGQLLDDGPMAYATPIGPVLRWAGASVVRRGEPLHRRPVPLTTAAAAPPSAQVSSDAEADTLARTLYGEARGEGEVGMRAVGHVVFNRIDAKSWWGRDVIGVCRKPWQFSCWNANDPNVGALRRVTAADASFRLAFDIASKLNATQKAGSRQREDITEGATHYYAPARVARPRWATGLVPCARIGGHLFFRGVA